MKIIAPDSRIPVSDKPPSRTYTKFFEEVAGILNSIPEVGETSELDARVTALENEPSNKTNIVASSPILISGQPGGPFNLSLDASINDLTDVDTSTDPPSDKQVLTWDNTAGQWVPKTGVGGDPFAIASGTDTITATFPTAPTLADGLQFKVRAAGANTGAATFNPNSLGALDLKKHGNIALAAGDIAAAGDELIIRYVAAAGSDPARYELVNPSGSRYSAGTGIDIDPSNVISSTLGSIALSGYPDDYAHLPAGLGSGDAGKAYMLKSDGLVYIWDGTAFPADGDGVCIINPAACVWRPGPDFAVSSPAYTIGKNTQFTTVAYDPTGMWDSPNNEFVISVAGLYHIVYAARSTTSQYLNLYVRVNGQYIAGCAVPDASWDHAFAALVYLAAGDVVEPCWYRQGSVTIDASDFRNFFSIARA